MPVSGVSRTTPKLRGIRRLLVEGARQTRDPGRAKHAHTAAGETPAEVAAAILQDEGRFVDLKRSIIWFAKERPFYP
jgi:hypothetical protein